nr:uncharacterized protein LOC109155154 [Ipomoea batatas]
MHPSAFVSPNTTMQKWFSSSKAGDDAQQQRMTAASHPLLLSPGRLLVDNDRDTEEGSLEVGKVSGLLHAVEAASRSDFSYHPKTAEAIAIINGLKDQPCITSFDLILQDIRYLASDLLDINFIFAKRSANRAAHHLARTALLTADRRNGDLSLLRPFFMYFLLIFNPLCSLRSKKGVLVKVRLSDRIALAGDMK